MGARYNKLSAYLKRIGAIESSLALIGWDSATMMPINSSKFRRGHLEELSKLYHELIISDQFIDLINDAKTEDDLDDWQRANIAESEYIYNEANSIPTKLAGEFAQATSECEIIWRKAKQNSDYNLVEPYLNKVVDLVRNIADLKAEKFQVSRYDALINQYDRGRTSHEIENIFLPLKQFLPDFIDEVIEKQKSIVKSPIPIEIEKQKSIAYQIMKDLGFDFDFGRVDESVHPFCGGIYGDVRITTSYYPDDALKGLMAIIHETGHAIYEQNLPELYYDQPVGKALGMSMHESQSLFYEMQIGASEGFIQYLASMINRIGDLKITPKEIWDYVNKVEKSFIRIFADELTYPLHVIIRFEMEKAIISGDITTKDIPGEWNKLMEKYLGITPKNDKEGCLQDIHWFDGSFGYFPCYSIGAIIASQLFNAANFSLGNKELQKSDFIQIKNWLNEKIHNYGSLYQGNNLLMKVTAKEVDPKIYISYLRNKFL